MPNYDALAAQGVHDLGNGIRVFAGQRDDPFYIDLGGLFDTLNLGLSPLPIETTAQDANDGANAFGVDMLSGFNVQEIAESNGSKPWSRISEHLFLTGNTYVQIGRAHV